MTWTKTILKKVAISTCASFSILAITSVHALNHQKENPDDHAVSRRAAPRALVSRPGPAKPITQSQSARADLSRALGRIELGSINPFDQITDRKPIENLLNKGVVHVQRQSFRSPRYQEESGYDLITFEITHPDQTTSTVVAYLEQTLDGPDRVPVVLIVSRGFESAVQSLYRAGTLTESRSVPLSVAQTMVAQRVNGGVPFLSVSR